MIGMGGKEEILRQRTRTLRALGIEPVCWIAPEGKGRTVLAKIVDAA